MENYKGYDFLESQGILIQLTAEQLLQISSPESIQKMIGKPDILAYDVYISNQLVGFIMLRKYSDTGYFLWNYAIDKRFQKQGHGTSILNALFEKLKTQFHATEVSTTYLWGNVPAKHLYEKTGFVETDVVFEDDVHEVNLIKVLEEGEKNYD